MKETKLSNLFDYNKVFGKLWDSKLALKNVPLKTKSYFIVVDLGLTPF